MENKKEGFYKKMKTVTITIANEKGGIGKTTTAQHLAIGLGRKGYKVLAIDTDSQRNLSSSFGDKGQGIKRIFDLLSGTPVEECIFNTKEGIHMIYGDERMSGAERVFIEQDSPYLLNESLFPVKQKYDFIIIDTPPKSNSIAVTNAFTTSDEIVIPLQANTFSLEGLKRILDTYGKSKKYTNHNLKVRGILLTMVDSRTTFGKQMREQIESLSKELGIPLFKSTIRRAVAIEESQALKTNVFDYQGKSKVAKDYEDFVNEILGADEE